MIWLITGGTHGIGKALCKHVTEQGHDVVTCSRSDYDISDPIQAKSLVDKTINLYGKIDVLVNNAAIYQRSTIEETPIDYWNKCIETNLNGTFYTCKCVLPLMKKHNFGRIINVSSYVAYFTPPERAAYTCSKLAVLGLTETLAKEVEEYDIKVNAFSPKKTATRMDLDGTAEIIPKEVAKQIYDLHKYEGTGKYFLGNEEVEWRSQ